MLTTLLIAALAIALAINWIQWEDGRSSKRHVRMLTHDCRQLRLRLDSYQRWHEEMHG